MPGDGGMISLTREDRSEIYYALELKAQALRRGKYGPEDRPGMDAEWITHLEAIQRTIGPDALAPHIKASNAANDISLNAHVVARPVIERVGPGFRPQPDESLRPSD